MSLRPHTTRGGTFLAVVAALFTVVVAILISSPRPLATIAVFLSGPWSNRFALGNFLSRAALLCITGAGVVIAFRAGTFNLGGEGQTYLGALVASVVITGVNPVVYRGFVPVFLAVAAAVGAGALLAGLSGWLRHRTGADELITSFLLSAAAIPVVDYLISGPLKDPGSNLLATPMIPEAFRLTRILPPSALNITFIWALLVVLVLWFLLNWTLFGYELRITGYNRDLARFSGIPLGIYTTVPMALSGALHGLAGAALVLGVHHRSIQGFSGGLGWNGIAVALIARNSPALVIPAALFFALLDAGSRAAVVHSQATWELGSLIQGVVFLFVTARLLRTATGRAA